MTFADLLIHPATRSALQAMLASAPQGVLLTGQEGVGKHTVALAWAAQLNPSLAIAARTIEPDDKYTISIETIRELYKASRGKHDDPQVLIIRDADAMAAEAQNAFLKLLEEPPKNVAFVLTSANPDNLLPTIKSRTQHIELHPLPAVTLRQHLLAKQPHISDQDMAQILFVASGRPGILMMLLEDADQLETQRGRMQQAKSLLSDTPYSRYVTISKLAADRNECVQVLQAMMAITNAQLQRAQGDSARRWLRIADALQDCLQRLKQNGNTKAQLLELVSSY